MPYISLEEHLPGITGLLEYRKDSAEPIRNLTQFLLRGPSTLTEGERELIATVVSHNNQCRFCTSAHAAAVEILMGDVERQDSRRQIHGDRSAFTPIDGKDMRILRVRIGEGARECDDSVLVDARRG